MDEKINLTIDNVYVDGTPFFTFEEENENSNKILSNDYEEVTIYDNLNQQVLAKITSDEVSTANTDIVVKLKPRI